MADNGVVWDDEPKAPAGVVWDDEAAPAPRVAPESLTEKGGLSHGPGTSFSLNALDSLSVVGLPNTLGFKDALMGDAKDGDFRTRFRKAKQFYEGGMKRLEDTNPDSATVGQLAPMVVPGGALAKGAKIGNVMKMGALRGAAVGAVRGPSATLDGEGDVVGETLVGGAAGLVTSGLGAAGGKAFERGGDLAAKGMNALRAKVRGHARSELGEWSQKHQLGAGGQRNEQGDAAFRAGLKERKPFAGTQRQSDAEWLADKKVNYNEKAEAALFKLRAKYGDKARPPTTEITDRAWKKVKDERTGALKRAVGGAAAGGVGYGVAEAAGVNPWYGAALAGTGGLYAIRKISQAAASHPATLKTLMGLRPIGQALARGGAKAASTPQNVGAIVYALRDDPEVAKVLKEYEAQNGTSE